MRYILLSLILSIGLNLTGQTPIQAKDALGESVDLREASMVIVIQDFVCSVCITDLNHFLRKIKTKGKTIYILYDTFLITPHQRIIYESDIKEKINNLPDARVVFLPEGSEELISTQLKECSDEKSPYVMGMTHGRTTIEYLCFDELFASDVTKRLAEKRIKSLLKSIE